MRFLWTVVAALLVASASDAQTDPLVGKWEGELQMLKGERDDPNRTLIIQSVDGNIAFGFYGYTGKSGRWTKIDVDRSGKRPSIHFVTGSNSDVRLNRMDEKSLVGTLKLYSVHEGSPDRSLTLRKVE